MSVPRVEIVQITITTRITAQVFLCEAVTEDAVERLAERVQKYFDGTGFDGTNVASRQGDRLIDVSVPNLWSDDLPLAVQLFGSHLRKALGAT
jgi:hypothetical protein